VLFWHRLKDPAAFSNIPVFIWKTDGGDFYGFPSLDGATMKSAADNGGAIAAEADRVAREILPEDETDLRQFLDGAFGRDQVGGVATAKTCLYTLTHDKNFLMDFHPEHPQVILASCCSGHGFKLSTAIGEALAGAAATGAFPRSVDFLRISH
jgi:sarcosine oxidase